MHPLFPRFLATLCVLAAPVGASPARAAVDAPQRGKRLFLDCAASHARSAPKYNPWYWVRYWKRHRSATRAALVMRIAKVPQVKWFAGASIRTKHGRRKMFERYFAGVDDPPWDGPSCSSPVRWGARGVFSGSYPVVALRAMKHDRCRG